MDKTLKLKIILLGPTSTGKTSIANFLSDVSEQTGNDIRKTRGVRIVEFQVEDVAVHGESMVVDIELWDCSGDRRYEPCWPVFFHEADGMILVCKKKFLEQKNDLEGMYNSAIDKSQQLAEYCIVFRNNFDDKDDVDLARAVKNILPKVESVEIDVEEKGDFLRQSFNRFLGKVASGKK